VEIDRRLAQLRCRHQPERRIVPRLHRLGILDGFRAEGAMTDGVDIRGPTDQVFATPAHPLACNPAPPATVGSCARYWRDSWPTVPGGEGSTCDLGLSFGRIDNGRRRRRVAFTDGTAADYDLVIGADGLYSATRAAIFPEAPKPRYIGQAVWRCGDAAADPSAHGGDVDGAEAEGRDQPCLGSQSYLFLTEDRPTNDHVPPETHVAALRALLRRSRRPPSRRWRTGDERRQQVVYRPLEQLLLPRPGTRAGWC
jgi:2-polyprenyl-6-methoxyphenol hydroxylase-like FAD-dependent oxidoreductase